MARILSSTRAVIEALGGVDAVASELQVTPNAVWNWVSFNQFPARTYVALHELMGLVPVSAPDTLWSMTTLASRQTEAA